MSWPSDHYKFLHMPRELCGSDPIFYILDLSKKYFHQILIVMGKSSVKWSLAPKPIAPSRLVMDYICDIKSEK